MGDKAVIIAFRRHTLLPLDDCLHVLQPSLTRSSLHRCLQRFEISRLSDVDGGQSTAWLEKLTWPMEASSHACAARELLYFQVSSYTQKAGSHWYSLDRVEGLITIRAITDATVNRNDSMQMGAAFRLIDIVLDKALLVFRRQDALPLIDGACRR